MATKQKPSLGGLQIHRSGAAPRPADAGAAVPASAPAPIMPAPEPAPAQQAIAPKRRALTLKLAEPDYQRLRQLAFDREEDHQTIMERAVLAYLDKAENGGT